MIGFTTNPIPKDMPSFIERPTPLISTLRECEQAATHLTSAGSRFCGLLTSLETQCESVVGTSSRIVTRIDTSICCLQKTLGQLIHTQRALVNTRNRFCSIMRIPDEVLSEIFIYAVYGPSRTYIMDVMHRRIEDIYQCVHALLGVCTDWRRVGLACRELWTVVPFADHLSNGKKRIMASELSLQRAGNKDLHLAISVHRFSRQRLEILSGHWHRFNQVNIWSDSSSAEEIHEVLGMIIKHAPPWSISQLSLRKKYTTPYDEFGREILADIGLQICSLVSSLSVFRTSHIPVDWSRTTFSRRLVELRVADLMLRNDLEITAFFAAVSSAHELKELKLISIKFDPSHLNSPTAIKPRYALNLPKLELLHLERLYFDVLSFILSHIAPGSYRVTLNLHKEGLRYYPETDWHAAEEVKIDRICAFLKGVAVNKLILWGSSRFFWAHVNHLEMILKSVASLKTLVLNYFMVNPDLLAALERPPGSGSLGQDTFPTLTKLEIHGAQFIVPLARLKPGFKAILDSHQIQHMVLGATLRSGSWANDGVPLDENDEVVGWMRRNVPRFRLSCEPGVAPEATDIWRLWDI